MAIFSNDAKLSILPGIIITFHFMNHTDRKILKSLLAKQPVQLTILEWWIRYFKISATLSIHPCDRVYLVEFTLTY